ncbi:MAG: iron-containing alcohol dehydrogenase [Defluviitaleaceae bacterium]|nr:iron-containing alcohol dehydrogenase [Defluviitaleaceae bacterium]
MFNFNYQNETKIIFGKDTEATVGTELAKHTKKVLLHYGGASAKATGLYDKVVTSLTEAGIAFVELGGVKPNPRASLVYEGIELCRNENIDFILAVGGGSVIDSAKAIAAGVYYDGDFWDLYTKGAKPTDCLKVATVLTIPAAGSEASTATVITHEKTNEKRGYGHPKLRPVFSILNPELTFTLPDYQTSCGLADMFAHVVERYFTQQRHDIYTTRLCEATMKTIVELGRKIFKDPNNYELRAEIMLAGMVAHNDWLGLGRGGDWSSHQIEHELSGFYDLSHGAGLCIIIPAWMKHVYHHDMPFFAQFANRVFDIEINTANLEETALKGIAELERFYQDINMPIRFADANLPTHEIDKLVTSAMSGRASFGGFVQITEADVKAIYELAL